MAADAEPKDSKWISARWALEMACESLDLASARKAILHRAAHGLIKAKSRLIVRNYNGRKYQTRNTEIALELFEHCSPWMQAEWQSGDFQCSTLDMHHRGQNLIFGTQFLESDILQLIEETKPFQWPAQQFQPTQSIVMKPSQSQPAAKKQGGRPAKSHMKAAAIVATQIAALSDAEFNRETTDTVIDRLAKAYNSLGESAHAEKDDAQAILSGIRMARGAK